MSAGIDRLDEALAAAAVSHLDGADHASVTVVDDGDVIRCLAATDEHPLVLDKIQRSCRQGPCLDAATDQRAFRVDDLAAERRWPGLTPR
jgi:hypothetical protein